MALSDRVARFSVLAASVSHPVVSLVYFRFYHLLLFFGLFGFLMVGGFKKVYTCLRHPFAITSIFLFVFPFITYFWSTFPDETLYRASVVSFHLPLFILTVSIMFDSARKQPYVLLAFYVMSFVLVSAYIYFQFGSFRANSFSMKQTTGAFSNVASALVLCCLPFFMSGKQKYIPSSLRYVLLLSSVLMIVLSQSRSALGLSIVAVGLTVLFLPGRSLGRIANIIATLIVCGFIFVFITTSEITGQYFSGTIERFFDSQIFANMDIVGNLLNPDRGGKDYTRALMYQHGWEVIREHWVFGAGFGTMKPAMEAAVGRGTISHNWIITSLGELGLLGFLCMVGVMFYSLYNSFIVSRMSHLPESLRTFSAQLFVAMFLLYLQSLTRPLYPNPLFSIFLGFSVWIVFVAKYHKR